MRRELQKISNVKLKIIPLVVGSLGAMPKQFGDRLKQIGITAGTAQVQKTVLLGTARTLRKYSFSNNDNNDNNNNNKSNKSHRSQ